VRELGERLSSIHRSRSHGEGIWQGLQMRSGSGASGDGDDATLRRNDINAWRERFLTVLEAAGAGR